MPVELDPTYSVLGLTTPEQISSYNRFQRQERQKRVVKDTDKLMALTTEYQLLLKGQGRTEASDRKLRDIEKLARDLRSTLVR